MNSAFWVCDTRRGSLPRGRLPNLRGVRVELADFEEDVDILMFRLVDSAHAEIFHRFCLDIIATASAMVDERQAVRLQSTAPGAGITS